MFVTVHLCIYFIFSIHVFLSQNQLPDWVRTHFDQLTENQGIWRCENDAYKNDSEPFDAYALKWSYVHGKRAIAGEMVAIQNEKVTGKLWQFYSYWNPKEQKLISIQFAADGTTGIGETLKPENGVDITIQDFYPTEGATYKVAHQSNFDQEGHHTRSFNISNDVWEKRRNYVWKNLPSFTKTGE